VRWSAATPTTPPTPSGRAPVPSTTPEVVLVRHGETEWSASMRHTSFTDIPLTAAGRAQARRLGTAIADRAFALVLTSPLSRAVETCREAGLGEAAQAREDLREWNYGEYEGVTTAEIRAQRPDWVLWRDGCPGGETARDVGRRADRVIGELRGLHADAALFAHGHVLRVLTARWLGLPPQSGALFALGTGTFSVLGYERENSVVWSWNRPPPGAPAADL
jgi:broad specificity phosphatase PhoE